MTDKTLTVGVLMEKLKQFDKDAKVFSDYENEGFIRAYKVARDAGNGKAEWWVKLI